LTQLFLPGKGLQDFQTCTWSGYMGVLPYNLFDLEGQLSWSQAGLQPKPTQKASKVVFWTPRIYRS